MVTPTSTYATGFSFLCQFYLSHPLAAFSVTLKSCYWYSCDYGDLAFRFDVEQSTVSRVINQSIPLLARHLRGLIKWPKTTIGPTDAPYNHMPNTVGIIDGTEIFILCQSNLATQKSSCSDYKSHTSEVFSCN